MPSKSSKWGLDLVHYIAKFTILRFVILRFEWIYLSFRGDFYRKVWIILNCLDEN